MIFALMNEYGGETQGAQAPTFLGQTESHGTEKKIFEAEFPCCRIRVWMSMATILLLFRLLWLRKCSSEDWGKCAEHSIFIELLFCVILHTL